jgi:hypothetical protein
VLHLALGLCHDATCLYAQGDVVGATIQATVAIALALLSGVALATSVGIAAIHKKWSIGVMRAASMWAYALGAVVAATVLFRDARQVALAAPVWIVARAAAHIRTALLSGGRGRGSGWHRRGRWIWRIRRIWRIILRIRCLLDRRIRARIFVVSAASAVFRALPGALARSLCCESSSTAVLGAAAFIAPSFGLLQGSVFIFGCLGLKLRTVAYVPVVLATAVMCHATLIALAAPARVEATAAAVHGATAIVVVLECLQWLAMCLVVLAAVLVLPALVVALTILLLSVAAPAAILSAAPSG